MNCESCGQRNDTGTTICSRCAASLLTHGAIPGQPAAPPTIPHAQRRQVTALFCDLVDSVSLTVRMDPEDMMDVIDIYLGTCNRIVSEHGGYIIQYMGDGVLAYFGYPRANEDDAANAVRAGLALRNTISGLDLPFGISLQVRVGIATGRVVVSDLAGQGKGREADLIGETPNLAARLQSVAVPGSVVVARSTQSITSGLFSYRTLHAFALKGFATPVEVFEALRTTSVASRFLARSQGKRSPLLGRHSELSALIGAWTSTCGGQCQIVLLQGEAGIGKSRLVEELRAHAAATPHAEMAWYCGPTYTGTALRPVAEQLRRSAGFDAGDEVETRRAKLTRLLARLRMAEPTSRAALADLMGLPPEPDSPMNGMPPDRRKAVIIDALLRCLDRVTDAGPALLVLEDAHWADPTTQALLERVIRHAAGRPWLILVTTRPEYTPDWSGQPDLTHIQLRPLDRHDAERLCAAVDAEASLTEVVMHQIVARCDGNPLYVEEMTKSVLEAAVHAPTRGGVNAVAIPMSVQDSLVARLDRLGPARRIANLGAAIGRRFDYQLLSAVAMLPDPALRRTLDDLVQSGLVESSGVPPNSAYLFKHALIRDAAYDSLLRRERIFLHGRIAAALRGRFGGALETQPELLAYHLTESGAIAEAIPLWAQAGHRAAASGAHIEAIRHFQNGLDLLLSQPEDRRRAEQELHLRLELIASLSASGSYSSPEVADALAKARAVCDVLGTFDGLFRLLRNSYLFLISAAELDSAEDAARRCVEAAEASGVLEQRIEADCALGGVLMSKGAFPQALVVLKRALRLYADNDGVRLAYSSPGDPFAVYQVFLAEVLAALGDDKGAEAAVARALSHARSVQDTYTLALATCYVACFFNRRGDYARTLTHANEAIALCETHGYQSCGGLARKMRAYATGNMGEPQKALAVVLAVLAQQDRLGVKYKRCETIGDIARLYAKAGDLKAALAMIDTAISDAEHYSDRHYLSPLYCLRAEILDQLPDSDPVQVARTFDRAVSIAVDQGAHGFARRAERRLIRHVGERV